MVEVQSCTLKATIPNFGHFPDYPHFSTRVQLSIACNYLRSNYSQPIMHPVYSVTPLQLELTPSETTK